MSSNVFAQHTRIETVIYETSAAGRKLERMAGTSPVDHAVEIIIDPGKRFQCITGIGGSFTQASAYILNRLSKANKEKILSAYFAEEGAGYSLTRTHINSCDFSLYHYAYANVPGDTNLIHFSIEEDLKGIIPMIKEARKYSTDGFKIIASPWTAPPWMKDNNDWKGGKLMDKYRSTWALYFAKYIQAYQQQGIPIWGITVENEPLGNDNNWESMLFTPEEMTDFVNNYLGPVLRENQSAHVKILGFDQNRGNELEKWATVMYKTKESGKYFDGMAVHWYGSTFDFFPESLQFTKSLAQGKHLINTEACIDAEIPKWKDDAWYWKNEATDWGWDWAPENEKYLHPKYVPVFRYARDIIGCLNNHVDGWIDWNMILNKQGGPNWAKNWCIAPVIADPESDEVYFTPLFYTIAHFSKFIRPGAYRIHFENPDNELMVTAVQNPDGSIVVVLFNPSENEKQISLKANKEVINSGISAKAIQTIVLKN